jgi:hypothetical protein
VLRVIWRSSGRGKYVNQPASETTNHQQQSRGDRLKNPPAPTTLEACLQCIALELARPKAKQDAKRLRQLHKLRTSYEGIETRRAADEERQVRKVEATAAMERNRIEQEQLELRRADYQKRYAIGEQTKLENKRREMARTRLEKPFDVKLEVYVTKVDDLLRRAKVEIESQKQTIGTQQMELLELRPRVKGLEAVSAELYHFLEEELKTWEAEIQTETARGRQTKILQMLQLLLNRDKPKSQEITGVNQEEGKSSILDEINEALVPNESLIRALKAGELPFTLLNPSDLNEMTIDELRRILASVSASDVVRKRAIDCVAAYENKKKELDAEGKHSPQEIETQALEALYIAKLLSS